MCSFFFFLPCIAPCTTTEGLFTCHGAAILLRAESGGEVIAWLAYGKPPSSIHLSLSFIIQLYLGCQNIYYFIYSPSLRLACCLLAAADDFSDGNSLHDVKKHSQTLSSLPTLLYCYITKCMGLNLAPDTWV